MINKEEIKKYCLTYKTEYDVEVIATSLEEAKKIVASRINESSQHECSQDLWYSLKYDSHSVSEPCKYDIEEYMDEHDDE